MQPRLKSSLFLAAVVCLTALNFGDISQAELRDPALYADQGHHHSLPDSDLHPDSIPSGANYPTIETVEHEHGMVEVPADQLIPAVNLIVHPDSRRGWNLEVQVTNFSFAPERVNQAGSTTEGHAHLYVDGVKITRLYGNWYYLESLVPGRREVTVSLNTNSHDALMHNGEAIESTVIVEVPTRSN